MVAYLVIDIDVHDPEGFKEYAENVMPFIIKHGGRRITPAGAGFEVVVGDFQPHRPAILMFPDRQSIRNLRDDPDYQRLIEIRNKTAKTISFAVDGDGTD
jgi:uncharacterized protein (DUF1330 family)